MILYLTSESRTTVKRCGVNPKLSAYVNTQDVAAKLGYDSLDTSEISQFIINQEISSLIESACKSKRFYNIIYQVPSVTKDIRTGIGRLFDELDQNLSKVVLVDTRNAYEDIHEDFDEVITKPVARKIRVIKAKRTEGF